MNQVNANKTLLSEHNFLGKEINGHTSLDNEYLFNFYGLVYRVNINLRDKLFV